MQNKIIVFVLIAVLAAGATWWFASPKPAGLVRDIFPATEDQPVDGQSITDVGTDFNGTLGDLLDVNNPVKCVTEFDLGGETQKQTVYSDGQNLRMETLMDAEGMKSNVYAVIKDGWQYAWFESNMPDLPVMGTKIKFDNIDITAPESPVQEGEAVDMSKVMKFSCEPWVVDSSMFVLPAGVEFNDITAQTQKLMENAPQDVCGMCDMMPDEETKAQCRQVSCAE